MDTQLSGRHVLITGASGGIGVEAVRLFMNEGCTVTAGYNRSPGPLRDLSTTNSGHMFPVKADVSSESDVQRMFEEADRRFGRVDVLVANAGIANHGAMGVHNMPIEQWQNTLAVNLTGVFLCVKHFFKNLERHREDCASLIMVGSTAGVFGEAGFCDYATSKAAMYGLLMSLKNEIAHLARRGRVNLVNPGWTLTPMSEAELGDEKAISRILQTMPMRKTAVPGDIASAIVFLASDTLAGHISGQAITIAGGMEGRVLFTPEETRAK